MLPDRLDDEAPMSPSHQQTHQAGRHFAVAQALLHGYQAKLDGSQTFVEVNGRRAAVMVAGKGAWMIADVEQFAATTGETFVLVDVASSPPVFYIVPGDELRRGVRERHDRYMARVVTRPRNPDSKHTKIEPVDVERWKDCWSLFPAASAEVSA